MLDLSKLRLCFLAGTLGQGGAERQLFYMLKGLRDRGAGVRLISLTRDEFWEKQIRNLSIPVTWIGAWPSRLARLVALVNALRKDPPDVVQSQHFYTNLYATAAARWLGLREIAALRNDGISEVQANGRLLGRLSLRVPRMLVANSRAAMRNALAMGVPDWRLHLLPNVVDTDQFKPEPRAPEPVTTLLAAGRLVEQKRMDRFLRVVNELRRQTRLPVKALIVGEGPLQSRLQKQAAEMGLLPDVLEFRGGVAEMASVYREADVLVLTSDWEGTPNVMLEAMACGLPVVATRVGGVADIIRSGETGRLVATDDEPAMTRALLELVAEPRLRARLGTNARVYVQSNHSPQRLPLRLAEIYEVALS